MDWRKTPSLPNTPQKTQSRLSSYFTPSPVSSKHSPTKRAAYGTSDSPIDLTQDANDLNSPPYKRRRISDLKSPSRSTVLTKAERREAFKKKLLLDNNPTLAKHNPQRDTETMSIDGTEGNASDQDVIFHELVSHFSKKSPGKGKGKVRLSDDIGPSGQSYTPLEKQVLRLKRQHPNTLLMIEVGYKYKFYGDDAKIAHTELGMACFPDHNFLVASIPTERRDIHLKRLLSRGYRVGIVNQTETAALKKIGDNRNRVFERQLVQLHTAATFVHTIDSVDDTDTYNPPQFLCLLEKQASAKSQGSARLGLITVVPSTGEVVWDDFQDEIMRLELETRLVHIRPAEILVPMQGLSKETENLLSHILTSSTNNTRIEYFEKAMTYQEAIDVVLGLRNDKNDAPNTSESDATNNLPHLVIIAMAHMIQHLSSFGIADPLSEVEFFSRFQTTIHMVLAANTLENLEIFRNETDHTVRGSLISALDRTKTKFGARLLKSWIARPLIKTSALERRIDAVQEIIDSPSELLLTLRQLLPCLPDLSRALCRIQYAQCTPRELSIVIPAFQKIAVAFDPVSKASDIGFKSPLLNEIIFSLPKINEGVQEISQEIVLKNLKDGELHLIWADPSRYADLSAVIEFTSVIDIELDEQLKSVRKLLKMPRLEYTSVKDDHYLIELKRKERRPIPDSWILISKTKTLERYRPPEVAELLNSKQQQEEMLQAEANQVYRNFLQNTIGKHYSALRTAVNQLAVADCLFSLATISMQPGFVRPVFCDEDVLHIVDGRHPIVEFLHSDPFVPNSIELGSNSKAKIITGPNMGGKSCFVKMVALIIVMAQVGCYVPASSVRMGLVDSILTRMGASDDLARGRSTFMVEMSETSEILAAVTSKSLVILDELGRGTSTFDGMAIASAVLQHLVRRTRCKTLFITHYPMIATELEKQFPEEVQNLHMGFYSSTHLDGSRDVMFMYRITPGVATESFGIECGRLAGMPESILKKATDQSETMRSEVENRVRSNRLKALIIKAIRKDGQDLTEEDRNDLFELRDYRMDTS